ncbi:hypothetical protein AKJ55_01440, partial [candidate division MSBL1 archaeon SCGC-AAA382M17]
SKFRKSLKPTNTVSAPICSDIGKKIKPLTYNMRIKNTILRNNMKVGIDQKSLANPSGIGAYAREICKHMDKNEVEIFKIPSSSQFRKNSANLMFDRIKTRFLEPILFTIEAKNKKLDLVHTLSETSIFEIDKPLITTIHDLTKFFYPNSKIPFLDQVAMKRKISLSDYFITPSSSTKKDLIRFFGLQREKIKVIPLGVDREFFNPKNKENCPNMEYSTKKPYILFLGDLIPRKNLLSLIKAFSILKNRKVQLVIGGGERCGGEYKSKLIALADNLNIKERIEFLGYVTKKRLPYLYSNAEVFVYPSLYEGFGIPLLEAMACGTPVITSSISSLPEVIGNAGMMIDPHDIEGLSEAIHKVIKSDTLQRKMKRKGMKRAKRFSWEKTAKKTFQVYNKVIYNR